MKFVSAGQRWSLPACLFVFSTLLIIVSCKKEPPKQSPARGSLQNQYGECLNKIVHGVWYNGYPAGTDTNYIDVSVFVASTGSYDLSTYRRNGVMFSASGNFTDTGVQVVRLKAIGSFLAPGEMQYPLSFDSSTCLLDVEILDSSSLSMADNTWQFTAGGHTYSGPAYGPTYSLPQGLGYSFEFTGSMASGSPDSVLEMDYVFQSLDTLPHLTTDGAYFGFHKRDGSPIFTASTNTAPAVVDIRFTSFTNILSPTSKVIEMGSFNGTARDAAQNIIPITNARFKLVW